MKKPLRWLLAGLVGTAAFLLVVPVLMIMSILGGPSGDDPSGCLPASMNALGHTKASTSGLDEAQLDVAAEIVREGQQLGVPSRGVLVALAVAHQESGLRNYANDGRGGDLAPEQEGIRNSLIYPHDAVGSDHGSLGVFQQQWPWWGTMRELMDPAVAADKFYAALKKVPHWQDMTVTQAGQAVQRSAQPDAYADDVPLARSLMSRLGAGTDLQTASFGTSTGRGCATYALTSGGVVFPLPEGSGYRDLHNWHASGGHWSHGHTGTDLTVACGTPVLAATSGTVIVRGDRPWAGRWLVEVSIGSGQLTTWYAHMRAIDVRSGEHVRAGQQLGEVGDLGNATGCHLHFEVHPHGGSIYQDDVDPTRWLAQHVGTEASVTSVPGGSALAASATILTGNVPFTLSPARASAQIRYLLSTHPSVLLLQEVTRRDVAGIVSRTPGRWHTWQPPGAGKGGSAIVWDADRFSLVDRGAELGFHGRRYSRWMTWALLRSDDGILPVVALHMPTNSSVSRQMRRYFKVMTKNYQELLRRVTAAGYSPVVGGDWNHPLDRRRETWSPVPKLRQVGFATNWQVGRPCAGTSAHGGRIDGFAFNGGQVAVQKQGCLPRRLSDHRPVWILIRPR